MSADHTLVMCFFSLSTLSPLLIFCFSSATASPFQEEVMAETIEGEAGDCRPTRERGEEGFTIFYDFRRGRDGTYSLFSMVASGL